MMTPEWESTIVHERLLERLFVFVAAVSCWLDGCVCCSLGCRDLSAPGQDRRQECHGDKEDSRLHGFFMYAVWMLMLCVLLCCWLSLLLENWDTEKIKRMKKRNVCSCVEPKLITNVSSGGQWKGMNKTKKGKKVSKGNQGRKEEKKKQVETKEVIIRSFLFFFSQETKQKRGMGGTKRCLCLSPLFDTLWMTIGWRRREKTP